MKKTISVVLVLALLAVTLTACGGSFSIEGKWKNTGDTGFGQAQPGAIVAFDGKNCNFFSPMDTYVLYKENGAYQMDVTAFLSLDTLNFGVEVLDKDHITVTYGKTEVFLQRVG